jgi:hypothetical protein
MNQLTVVLITALVTGVISISGIWFGSHLTRKSENRKWRRDHALEAYSQFSRQVDVIVEEATTVYRTQCGSEQHIKHGMMAAEKLVEMYRTTDRIILLASDELQAPFSALSKYMPEFAEKLAQCPKATEDEIKAAKKKLIELQARFMMYARNDLGVHPQYQEWNAVKPWWRFWR